MTDPDPESASKDRFYARLSALADEMIEAHGKDFTMGSLILAARFIAEKRPDRDAGGSNAQS